MSTITRYTAGINGALGGWLMATPFIYGVPGVSRWSDMLVGFTVALVAGCNYTRAGKSQPASTTGAGLITVCGFWLIVKPFVFGLEGAVLWHDVVWGTIVASFGGYNAYVAALTEQPTSFRLATE